MSITKGKRFKILARDGFACRYCGRKAPDVVLHVDHIHPQAQGGSDHPDNLTTACYDCNMGKSGRLVAVELRREPTSLPHVDQCGDCRPGKYYAAIGERPSTHNGYAAKYRCNAGHEWETWWSNGLRLHPVHVREFLKEHGDITTARNAYLREVVGCQ